MNGRPWTLLILSISFVLLALSPLLGAIGRLGAWDLLILGLGLWGAGLAWNLSKLLPYCMAPLALLILWRGWESFSEHQLGMAGAFVLAQGLWLMPSSRRVLLDPTQRWWRTPPRVLCSTAALVKSEEGAGFSSTVLNLSVGGLLLDVYAAEKTPLSPGQIVELSFLLDPYSLLQCRAEVLRQQEDPDIAQYGLRFVDLELETERRLARYVEERLRV